jgi:hypothetical protein
MALVMGKQCCNNARWKKLLYPENSGLYFIYIMQLKKMAGKKYRKKLCTAFFRGAYATIAIIVSPSRALMYLNHLNLLNPLNLIFRGAYAPIAIIVSPSGAFRSTTLIGISIKIMKIDKIIPKISLILFLPGLLNPCNSFFIRKNRIINKCVIFVIYAR